MHLWLVVVLFFDRAFTSTLAPPPTIHFQSINQFIQRKILFIIVALLTIFNKTLRKKTYQNLTILKKFIEKVTKLKRKCTKLSCQIKEKVTESKKKNNKIKFLKLI